jgi:hypothetical protein
MRKVVGQSIKGPKRRKVRREIWMKQLEDLFAAKEILEPMLAEVAHSRPGREIMGDGVGGGLREQHLTAPADRRDPCGPVDLQPNVPAAGHNGLARVQSHPETKRNTLGPGKRRDGPLRRQRGLHRIGGVREDDEQTLAGRILLVAPGAMKDLP